MGLRARAHCQVKGADFSTTHTSPSQCPGLMRTVPGAAPPAGSPSPGGGGWPSAAWARWAGTDVSSYMSSSSLILSFFLKKFLSNVPLKTQFPIPVPHILSWARTSEDWAQRIYKALHHNTLRSLVLGQPWGGGCRIRM